MIQEISVIKFHMAVESKFRKVVELWCSQAVSEDLGNATNRPDSAYLPARGRGHAGQRPPEKNK